MREKWDPRQLNVKITTKSAKLNAYIYAGSSRKLSTQSLVDNNAQISVGQEFKVEPDSGFLIVAYPTDGMEEELGFEFWVDAVDKSVAQV